MVLALLLSLFIAATILSIVSSFVDSLRGDLRKFGFEESSSSPCCSFDAKAEAEGAVIIVSAIPPVPNLCLRGDLRFGEAVVDGGVEDDDNDRVEYRGGDGSLLFLVVVAVLRCCCNCCCFFLDEDDGGAVGDLLRGDDLDRNDATEDDDEEEARDDESDLEDRPFVLGNNSDDFKSKSSFNKDEDDLGRPLLPHLLTSFKHLSKLCSFQNST